MRLYTLPAWRDWRMSKPLVNSLRTHRQTLQRWQGILAAIEQRESIQRQLNAKREERDGKRGPNGGEVQEGLVKRIFRFEEHQKTKIGEPRLRDELKAVIKTIVTANERIEVLEAQRKAAENAEENAKGAILKAENEFNQVMGRFGECIFPEFAAKARMVEDIPDDFDPAIALFLRQQTKQASLAEETARQLAEVERWFGDEFRGDDEQETIRLLREELEALADKEDALARDWNAHIHGLKATFDRVLKELGEVQSAKDDLNRQFAKVQVSNLKSVKMEVIEQTDLMSWIRRLGRFRTRGAVRSGSGTGVSPRKLSNKAASQSGGPFCRPVHIGRDRGGARRAQTHLPRFPPDRIPRHHRCHQSALQPAAAETPVETRRLPGAILP